MLLPLQKQLSDLFSGHPVPGSFIVPGQTDQPTHDMFVGFIVSLLEELGPPSPAPPTPPGFCCPLGPRRSQRNTP